MITEVGEDEDDDLFSPTPFRITDLEVPYGHIICWLIGYRVQI